MLNERVATADTVRVVAIPVRRDQLLPLLTKGLGDIALGNLTVTPEREGLVDFSAPFVRDVRELVVTAPGSAPVATPHDLAGREVWVRRSSSYYESLRQASERLVAEGLEPIDIRAADENLEDEALLDELLETLYHAPTDTPDQVDAKLIVDLAESIEELIVTWPAG